MSEIPGVVRVQTSSGRGSGFLVSPQDLVTCWHVLAGQDARDFDLNAEPPMLSGAKAIGRDDKEIGLGQAVGASLSILGERFDLALAPLSRPAYKAWGKGLRVAGTVGQDWSWISSRCRIAAGGYKGGLDWREIPLPRDSQVSGDRVGLGSEIFGVGRIFGGMSGSPICARVEDRVLVVGVVQLGGDKSGFFAGPAADVVARLIDKVGLRGAEETAPKGNGYRAVDAREWFVRSVASPALDLMQGAEESFASAAHAHNVVWNSLSSARQHLDAMAAEHGLPKVPPAPDVSYLSVVRSSDDELLERRCRAIEWEMVTLRDWIRSAALAL